MQLSKRLMAVAGLVQTGTRLADVGTDHGYIPIYLVQNGICDRAIAMDVKKGPLQRAETHISRYGLADRIATRLSDGLGQLQPGEADCMVAAGMGGMLVIHILEEGRHVIASMKECILQPQSDIDRVRKYLWEYDYAITQEDMVLEDGKYYPMMRVVPGVKQEIPVELFEVYAQYGQFLLEKKHPVLQKFLYKEYATAQKLLQQLSSQVSEGHERMVQLHRQMEIIKKAMELAGMEPVMD